MVKNTSIICWHFWEERRVELSTNKVPSISLLHFTLQILRNTLQIPYKWHANTSKCITNTLKTRDIFWRKELQLQLLKGLCDTGSPSCAPPDPTDPIVHGCWKYLINIFQIFCKFCTNTLHFFKKYITNMYVTGEAVGSLTSDPPSRHLIQLHHTTRPLQLHIICICIFFWIFICTLILFCNRICLYNCPTLQTKMSQQLLEPNSQTSISAIKRYPWSISVIKGVLCASQAKEKYSTAIFRTLIDLGQMKMQY